VTGISSAGDKTAWLDGLPVLHPHQPPDPVPAYINALLLKGFLYATAAIAPTVLPEHMLNTTGQFLLAC
jgi:hypothetical protein